MSKHHGRKSRWTEVSGSCRVSSCGNVTSNPRGRWDAVLHYKQRTNKNGTPAWMDVRLPIGEYRRTREAMVAVEERAKDLLRTKNDSVIVVFTE